MAQNDDDIRGPAVVIGQDYNIIYLGAGSPCVAGKVGGSMIVVRGAILDAVCELLMPDSVKK